ncbi:MAG: DNA helicase RecQ, partial [Candidatus Cloacimonetes bacterium]|nr:DNA helicase RecQ [Candidatus Cloacimonadota bacterium]
MRFSSEMIVQTLSGVFGYDSFLPAQEEVISSLLAGKSTLAVMPTGSGKSLCYQLPALLLPGLTIVVSPMISLMKDQVMQMQALGVKAEMHHSGMSFEDLIAVRSKIRARALKLLYVAPETLTKDEFLGQFTDIEVDLIAIDEAHCISTWGHDFRPEYRQLGRLKQIFPQAVCFALTATATHRVRKDICAQLAIPLENQFIESFNRKNLLLTVEPKRNTYPRLLNFLAAHAHESGLIYCFTRKHVDDLADRLQTDGYSALPYHAGLSDIQRNQNQEAFIRDEVKIIVATIAFGMGINKSNIRFVVHYDLPRSLETYYQEIGRSGRDGLPSVCLLFSSYSDLITLQNIIQRKEHPERIEVALEQLNAMMNYVRTNGCRRIPLLNWFGEKYSTPGCGMCDNCIGEEGESADASIQAQKFLSAVYRSGQIFAVNHIIDILRGSRAGKVKDNNHDQLSVYGIGREWNKEQWFCLCQQLTKQGFLEEQMPYFSLRLNEKSWQILHKETQFLMPKSLASALMDKTRANCDQTLWERLQALRYRISQERNLPPYIVFSDATLREMASFFPQSLESLKQISGVGEYKLKEYGRDFLEAIQAYASINGIIDSTPTKHTREKPAAQNQSTRIGELFKSGKSLQEIMIHSGIKLDTVLQHLCKYVQGGGSLPWEPLKQASTLSEEDFARVCAAFSELGSDTISPIYQKLN